MAERGRWVLALGVLLLGLVLRGQDLSPLLDDLGERDNPSPLLRDFRDTMYEPGRDTIDGHNPYDPEPYMERHPGHQELDLYVPHFLVLAVPASMVPVAVSQGIWLAVMAGAVVLLAAAGWRLADRSPPAWASVASVGFLLLINPVTQALRTGNVSLVCCAALAWVLATRDDRSWTTVAAGAVACIKPQLGLPLLALLAIGPAGRALAVRIVGAVAVLSIAPVTALLVDSGGVGGLLDVVGRNLDHSSELYGTIAGNAAFERADLWGAIAKLADTDPTTGLQLLTFVAVLVIAVAAIRRGGEPVAASAVAAGAVVLGLPHYSYDLVLVGPPLIMLAARGIRGAPPATLVCGLGLVLVAAHVGATDRALEELGFSLDLRQALDALALSLAFVAGVVALLRDQPAREAEAVAAR